MALASFSHVTLVVYRFCLWPAQHTVIHAVLNSLGGVVWADFHIPTGVIDRVFVLIFRTM